jgi:hypothetical protein
MTYPCQPQASPKRTNQCKQLEGTTSASLRGTVERGGEKNTYDGHPRAETSCFALSGDRKLACECRKHPVFTCCIRTMPPHGIRAPLGHAIDPPSFFAAPTSFQFEFESFCVFIPVTVFWPDECPPLCRHFQHAHARATCRTRTRT